MESRRHTDTDRLTIASLAAIAGRRSGQLTKGECTLDDAVAEIREHSTDPHLLAHAIGGTDWSHEQRREILIAAGAAPDEVDAQHAEVETRLRRGGGLAALAENLQKHRRGDTTSAV